MTGCFWQIAGIGQNDELNTIKKMKKKKPGFVFLAFIIFFTLTEIASEGKVPVKSDAIQWMPWEDSLKAVNHPDRGPAFLEVIFTGPGGVFFKNQAFTDDKKVYHFRAAFPSPGNWKWKTVCPDRNDKGLHNRTGTVRVKSYTGDNPLYKHGDLRVSDDGRYLVHSDGTPFLWMGETGWRMTQRSTMEEWRHYIDTRAAQKFSVIQISPRGVSKKPETELAAVSLKENGTTDPVFWHDLEAKIRYANSKGIVMFMVGISKVWSDEIARNPVNQEFGSYITGRMASCMVIFSPSFDQVYDKGNDSMAVVLNQLTSHLVTQHPGTNYEANLRYRNSPATDFCGMQSGHHGGNLVKAYNAARQWTLDMWNGTPVKPVVDIEAMYDAHGNNNARNWREKDVRKLGWMAWLSGSKGYTYGAGDVPPKVPRGAGGVWRFNTDSTAYDYWRKAILWPSAGQMTIMHDFFRSIEWWKLAPSHHLILNQAENDTLKMAVSITPDKNQLLAYLPDNPEIELNLSALSGKFTGQWFNPATGIYIPINVPVNPSGMVAFRRPEGWEDAVLLITKS